MNKSRVVHRWQPNGKTPCGLKINSVKTNIGYALDAGVTCKRCKNALSRVSLMGAEWNGEYDGYPLADGAITLSELIDLSKKGYSLPE